MRMYDVKTGKRFDRTHEMWKKHMLNKDGSAKKRMDHKKARELEGEGLIRLVPSVTEIASVGNGFGVFKFAAEWGMEIGVDAVFDTAPMCDNEIRSDTPWKEEAVKRARAVMDAPKEKGSDLHDLYHRMIIGEVKKPTKEEKKFKATCDKALEQVGIGTDFRTEEQFATDEYGGTPDLNAFTAGVDWKTCKDFRPVRMAELLQLGAYANHFGWREGHIVYIRQSDFAFKVLCLNTEQLLLSHDAFRKALLLWHQLNKLKDIKV